MTIPASTVTGGHATDGEIVDNQAAINALLALLSGQPASTGTTTQVLHGGAAGFSAIVNADITSVDAGKITTGTLPEARGGTNQSTYTQGDVLYASAANTLAKLAKGTSGQLFRQGATIPGWAGDTSWTAVNAVGGAAPAFIGTWVNSGGGNQAAAIFKDASGFIHLRGLVTGGTVNTQIISLPTGYRPAANSTFPGGANGVPNGEIVVTSGGSVQQQGSASATNTSLDGITFDAL